MRDRCFTTDGPFKYPFLWNGCVCAAAPLFGPNGLGMIDFPARGAISGATADALWQRDSTGLWAYKSSGTDNYTNGSAVNGLNGSSQAAISFWTYKTATSDWSMVSVGDSLNYSWSSVWTYYSAQFYSEIGYGSSFAQGRTLQTFLPGWNHLCLTFANSALTLWLNGISCPLTTLSGTMPATMSISGNYYIGKCQYWGSLSSAGVMTDDVRFYGRCLSSDEIQLLYSNGNGRGIAYTPASDEF